jgi:fused signal recognition particle receptor
MFDGLRKKLSDAVRSFVKTEKEEVKKEEKAETAEVAEKKIAEPIEEKSEVYVKDEKKDEPQAKEEKKNEIKKPDAPVGHAAEKREESLVKLSLKTKIKSAFVGSIRLSDSDIDRFLESMKMSMLQSDVSYDTTEEFLASMGAQLKSRQVSSKNIEGEVVGMMRASLLAILNETKTFNMVQVVRERISEGNKPVKILFLGPNGTGKTTTIAKIAYSFKGMGISCVLSASDTFRAAAIEQVEHHANKIGVPIIKSSYGSDPASVAFDAIAYAKAHGIDSVLIDSAGRQDTNKSLIDEMRKMVRVAKPDLIIFVGESTAGNMISEQIKEFGKFMSIDGIILTKLDCDAKGGGALSIAHLTGRPVLFFGTGEGYDALVPYSNDFVLNAILPNT